MGNRVVVTGLGIVTPLGSDLDQFWAALLAGRSAVGPITRFDTEGLGVKIAAEVSDFDPNQYLDRKAARRMDLFSQYAIAASSRALEHSKLDLGEVSSERLGVVMGTGQGGIESLTDQMTVFLDKGPRRVSPFCIPMMISNMAAGHVGIKFRARGPNLTLTTACAASAHALGEAYRILQRDEADVIIGGGTEAGIVPLSLAGFTSMRALSTRNAEPQKASRPFDADRDGFVMGEGAAVLIMETLEHAQKRGAEILAELRGYALTGDAHHITAPPPSGEGGARAIKAALKDADLTPEQVDYVNAHGTGTPAGDPAESRALEAVFGDAAFELPISSTKSMIGHLLGASGALESVVCILSILSGKIHPTINLQKPDEECRLDYVPHEAREAKVDVALTNSFGFGGQNATLVWGRCGN